MNKIDKLGFFIDDHARKIVVVLVVIILILLTSCSRTDYDPNPLTTIVKKIIKNDR
jgi:hypothetical protein